MNYAELMDFQSRILEAMPKFGMDPSRTTIVSSPLSTALGVVPANPGQATTEKDAEAPLDASLRAVQYGHSQSDATGPADPGGSTGPAVLRGAVRGQRQLVISTTVGCVEPSYCRRPR